MALVSSHTFSPAIAALVVGATTLACQPTTLPAGQLDLTRLVDLAAAQLKLTLDYDAAALKAAGTVTLRLEAPLSDQELWALMNRLLAARGFTTVRSPGVSGYSVVRTADAAAVAPLVSDEPGPAPGVPPGFQTIVVRAKYRPAKDLADSLAKVLTKSGGSAVPLGDGGLLLISDLAGRVEHARNVLSLIDVPSAGTVIEEITVRHLSAQALAALVAQVTAKRELVSGEKFPGEIIASPNGNAVLLVADSSRVDTWRELLSRLDHRERVESASYLPRAFSAGEVARLIEQTVREQPGVPADDRWRLVTDDLTGTLIITATPSQHEQIRSLLERLESTPSASQRPVRTFVIKNRPVLEIQEILERMSGTGLISGGGPSTDLPGTSRSGPAPWPPADPRSPPPTATPRPATPLPSPLPRPLSAGTPAPLVLTVDEGTNTLIAMAEPRILAQVETLLLTLDVRQPQVMLEVLIVSLNDAQTLELGVELDKLITAGDTLIRLSSLFGLSARGPGLVPAFGAGAGFTGTVLDPGEFSAVIRALQTINKGRSLSMPRLLVANNQQATLDSTLDQPYASTNASNTVTTTSYGGSQQAGTQVTLRPQITESNHLNLDYSISLSAFTGAAASANLPPPKQQNKVASAASIPDGYTVVVGGIELSTNGLGTSQIPGIGDIPILGEAFKNRTRTQSRTRFYVFIRAGILRARGYEDLKYLSDAATSDAAISDGFPAVEPQVIR